MAEALHLSEVLAEALTSKAMVGWHRLHEAEALLREANRVAMLNDLPATALRAQFNLSGLAMEHSRFGEAREVLEEALALARLRGDRSWEAVIIGQLADTLVHLGEWSEAEALCRGVLEEPQVSGFPYSLMLLPLARILLERGEVVEARRFMAGNEAAGTTDRQSQAAYSLVEAMLLRLEGDPRAALAVAERALEQWLALHQYHYVTETLVEAAHSAFELGDTDRVESLLATADAFPWIQRRPFLDAQTARLGARLAAERQEPADERFERATEAFRALAMPYWVGVTRLEQATCRLRAGAGDDVEAPLEEARAIFERLGAEPMLAHVRAVAGHTSDVNEQRESATT